MKNNDNYLELMERYLDNTLDQEEVADFHKRLKSDPGFRHLFNEMDLLIDGIQYSASKTTLDEKLDRLEELLEDKEEEDEEISEENNYPKIILIWNGLGRYRTAIAASIVLLLATTVVFFTIDNTPQSERLFEAYFNPAATMKSSDRGNLDIDNLKMKAATDFREKNYIQANMLYSKLLEEDPGDNESMYYSGICQLQLGSLNEAEISFKTLIVKGNRVSASKWFLSLCFVRGEKYEDAGKLLKEIIDGGTSRAEDAQKLLVDLQEKTDME